jgi:hypothetical protein
VEIDVWSMPELERAAGQPAVRSTVASLLQQADGRHGGWLAGIIASTYRAIGRCSVCVCASRTRPHTVLGSNSTKFLFLNEEKSRPSFPSAEEEKNSVGGNTPRTFYRIQQQVFFFADGKEYQRRLTKVLLPACAGQKTLHSLIVGRRKISALGLNLN